MLDAERAKTAALAKLDRGGDPFPSDLAFGHFAEKWLEGAAARIRPRTIAGYRGLLERDVLPALRDVRLDQLKPAHVRAVLDAMTSRGLSPSTVRQAKAVMGTILRQAVEDGLTDVNPVRSVRAPKIERPELDPPDAAALGRLVSVARGTAWDVPMLLSVATGARRGEVLAVRWQDVDLARREVRIRRSLQWIASGTGRRLEAVGVKTAQSRRTISLPGFAVERLRAHRREQAERYLLLGPAREQDDSIGDLVCDRGDGRPCDPDAYTTSFKAIAKRAGLSSSVRLHDVRHGVASTLAAAGTPLVTVAAVLGHASTVFTSTTYQHSFRSMTDAAAEALDAAIGAGS
jgi:integrase